MFDKEYNKIIDLLSAMDDDFSDYYNALVDCLPFSITHKCKKLEPFEIKKENNTYRLDVYGNDEIEFMVYKESDIKCSLNVYKINFDELMDMEKADSDGEFVDLDDCSVMELAVFEGRKGNGDEYTYSFFINRRNDGFYVVENKVLNNKKTISKKIIDVDMLSTNENKSKKR